MNILLGITGSVAAIKTKELVEKLLKLSHEHQHQKGGQSARVKVVLTEHAKYFASTDLEELVKSIDVIEGDDDPALQVLYDKDEWNQNRAGHYERGDKVLHIELRKWADLFIIAPLDANTLAKMANGLADNLISCILRCWDPTTPLLLCPAMNTFMWNHPVTFTQLERIKGWGFNVTIVSPVEKLLACGDFGPGAMESVDEIIKIVKEKMNPI